jgi:RNA polymerase sigma factor (sigma-70 family)
MANGPLSPILRHVRRVGGAAPAADGDRPLLERFTADGDTTAFAALVRRHGPMVLGVCRRVLRDPDAADDAFQATFLLLVRKARSLRRPDALGPWLYRVARRTALKTRTLLASRRARERPLVDRPVAPADDLVWRDLRPVLDDLIARLPAKERGPVVLCDLEGLTQAEAARQLGCPPGTVATRLTRARQRLRARLVSRGIAPAAGVLAAGLAPESLAEAVPAVLVRATVKAVGGEVPGGVAVIVKGVIGAMLMERIKVVLLVTAGFGAAGSGAGVVTYRALAQEPGAKSETAPPVPASRAETARESVPSPDRPARTSTAVLSHDHNFVVTAPTREVAEEFARKAEVYRREKAMEWVGHEMPPWPQPCPLTVHPKPTGAGGATKFDFNGSGGYTVLSMDIEGNFDRMLISMLPHEITHTVLAHYFRAPIPRWADEGAAVLSNDEAEQRAHYEFWRALVNAKHNLPLRRLFNLKDYQELNDVPDGVLAFYAHGYSVTRFLVQRKGRGTFLAFVKQGMAGDWDKAVKEQYGFATVEALEEAWLAQLRKTRAAPEPLLPANPPAEKPPEMIQTWSPTMPGSQPRIAQAYVDQQGRLALRQSFAWCRAQAKSGPDGVTHSENTLVPGFNGRWELYEPGEVSAYDLEGRPIDRKKLTELLPKETVVLAATDGRKPDPFYLQLIKPGTIVLVPPLPPGPAPPAQRTVPPLDLPSPAGK